MKSTIKKGDTVQHALLGTGLVVGNPATEVLSQVRCVPVTWDIPVPGLAKNTTYIDIKTLKKVKVV